jgi:hypothetical protein
MTPQSFREFAAALVGAVGFYVCVLVAFLWLTR